jgi:hypothetical protein
VCFHTLSSRFLKLCILELGGTKSAVDRNVLSTKAMNKDQGQGTLCSYDLVDSKTWKEERTKGGVGIAGACASCANSDADSTCVSRLNQ